MNVSTLLISAGVLILADKKELSLSTPLHAHNDWVTIIMLVKASADVIDLEEEFSGKLEKI
ncbi:hypothetical protein A0U40_00850 [[Bacillus] sp. KCTC 13219]|nr:hypothetical protein A0U40_00850 [[Bacillus] sp. KCTC 13219]